MADVFTAFVLSGLLLIPVSVGTFFFAAEAPDYNNERISALLEKVHYVHATDTSSYAVFDWDNTCMFGDISYTAVLYQVENLNFRIKPQEFETLFALGYNANRTDICLINGTNSVLGQDINGVNMTLATLLSNTAKDYKVLFDAYIGPTYDLTNDSVLVSLADIKKTREFSNLRAKLAFLTFNLEAMDGGDDHSNCAMTIAMTVFPQLLVGMSEDEIRSLIRSSIRWNLAESLEMLTYISTGEVEVEGKYSKGLRYFNGQESTMRALRAAQVDVYVISASPQLFAEEAANLFGLGNTVPTNNVYGVRYAMNDAGLFTGKLVDKYPITWGPGKATIVSSILQQIHNGTAPIYASGDATGDCEMLSTVRNGIVHTNNRLKSSSSCIHEFYKKACKYFGSTEPITNNVYLLQGQDQTIGTWITSGFSTKDGATYESGLASHRECAHYYFLNDAVTL